MKIPANRLFKLSGFVLAALAASLGFACSETADGDGGVLPRGPTGGSGGGLGGSTGTAAAPGTGNTTSSAGTGIDIPIAGTGGDAGTAGSGPIDPTKACGTGNAEAKLQPVNMFIQFDRSGSMEDDNKWEQASNALTGFFGDPQSAGLRVALRFFPHDLPAAGCQGGGDCDGPTATCCNIEACAQPLVPLGELLAEGAPMDSQESALIQAVGSSGPGGGGKGGGQGSGTPLWSALAGAVEWAVNHKSTTPNEATVVVFVTDGEPNGCDESISGIAQHAANGLTQGVPTYVIGISGVSDASVDQIAMAGGTERAFFAGGANPAQTQQDLIAALNAIRGSVLSCQFAMPTASSAGQEIDPTKINVNYTPSATGLSEVVGQSPDGAACGIGGWYYDNPTAPTTINLCEADCSRITADPMARIEVLLGCAPIPAQPPR